MEQFEFRLFGDLGESVVEPKNARELNFFPKQRFQILPVEFALAAVDSDDVVVVLVADSLQQLSQFDSLAQLSCYSNWDSVRCGPLDCVDSIHSSYGSHLRTRYMDTVDLPYGFSCEQLTFVFAEIPCDSGDTSAEFYHEFFHD